MQRARQSRRSACDRCRMYKLRCERPSPQELRCPRCLKSGASCIISEMPIETSSDRVMGGQGEAASSKFRVQSSTAFGTQTPRESMPPMQRPDLARHGLRAASDVWHPIEIELGSPITHAPVDCNLANFTFGDHSEIPLLGQGDDQRDRVHGESPGSFPSDGLTGFSDSAVALSAPSFADAPSNALQDVLELCAEIVRDKDVLQSCDFSDHLDAGVQNMLAHTSRFLDILASIVAGEPDTHLPQKPTQHMTQAGQRMSIAYSAAPGPPTPVARCKSPDILLTTTLVTAHLLLRRAWRGIFYGVHQLLARCALGDASGLPELPGLQLGGYRVRSSPRIQVVVLLELTSDMLHRIETVLGISAQAGHPGPQEGSQDKSPVLRMDPVSLSINETLLAQDRLRTEINDECGDLSLQQIIEKVREQVTRR